MNKGFIFGGNTKPAPQKKRSAPLKPVSRETGERVTMENCKSGECRWPYGEVAPDMVMCGRPAERGKPFCAEHRMIAYDRSKPLVRL